MQNADQLVARFEQINEMEKTLETLTGVDSDLTQTGEKMHKAIDEAAKVFSEKKNIRSTEEQKERDMEKEFEEKYQRVDS